MMARFSHILHDAALDNEVDAIDWLLQVKDCETDINYVDKKRRNCLHCLFLDKQFSDLDLLKRVLELLKKHGANINTQDHLLNTPLHLVFETYTVTIPDVVLVAINVFPEFDWTITNARGYSLFHMFMSDMSDWLKNSDKAERVLQKRNEFIRNVLDGNVSGVSEDVVGTLLNSKEISGYTAFQTYLDGEAYSMDTIALMIQKGANIDNSSNLGITPLMQSCLRERDDLVKMLLENGADPNKRDVFGQSAVFRVRTVESFQLLIKYGADIHISDRSGRSPIASYIFHVPQNFPIGGLTPDDDLSEYPLLAKMFFEHGQDVTVSDRHGSTLLHYAAWWSYEPTVKNIIDKGGKIDTKDHYGLTPYDLALRHGNVEILPLLQTDSSIVVDDSVRDSKARTRRFSNLAINEINIDDMKNVLSMLEIRENPRELISLLMEIPNFGMVSRKPEARDVVHTVNSIMQKAADILCALDFRFRASIKPTGSSSEGTMIGDPCEFDFVFCLEYFSQECHIIQPYELLNTGCAKLAVSKKDHEIHHPLDAYETQDGYINATDVRDSFQDLLVEALNKPEVWEDENVYFDGLLKFPDDKPILNLDMSWSGATYKELIISVDMVPALYKPGWFPVDVDKDKLTMCSDKVRNAGYFILFHGPNVADSQFESYVRISSAAMEIEFFKTSPEIYREIYATCKILKNRHFCPLAQFDDEEESVLSDSTESNEIILEDENDKVVVAAEDKSKKSGVSSLIQEGIKMIDGMVNPDNDLKTKREVCRWVAVNDVRTRKILKIYTPKESSEQIIQNSTQPLTEEITEQKDGIPIYSRLQNVQGDIQGSETNENVNSVANNKRSSCNPSTKTESQIADKSQWKRSVDESSDQMTKKRLVDDINKEESVIVSDNPDSDVDACCVGDGTSLTDEPETELGMNMDAEMEGGDIVEADEYITSYMLKNCLLHILSDKRKQSGETDLSKLEVVKGVYEYLLTCSEQQYLSAYCMPFINIFSYVNEHIRHMDEQERVEALELSCYRISCFCKIILGILNQD